MFSNWSARLVLPLNWLRRWVTPLAVGLAMMSALLLPLNLLATQRFHHDEALYATWGLEIASGRNPWLTRIPIDKPPLFLYTLAASLWLLGATETATRLPSLLATAITVWLTFSLGRKLYGPATGALAAWLVALSPFTLLFAPTAFTDPMLVTLILAACLAAVYGRPGWAGFFLGLAIITKQQGVFFVLLVWLLGVKSQREASHGQESSSKVAIRNTQYAIYFTSYVVLTTLLTLLPTFIWDFARDQSPGFWQMSLVNYGGLATVTANFGQRWWEFVQLLYYNADSPLLNTIFVAGLPLLLLAGLWQNLSRKPEVAPAATHNPVYADWLFALFILAFLAGHAWLSFQVWDRYLLGLIPLLALLLARILLWPWSLLKYWLAPRSKLWSVIRLGATLALVGLLGLTLSQPVQDAANARYPLGSNSGALSGIEQITAYLQGHAGANTTLYHHWLGTHWRFYLWGYPYDLRYWQSPQDLVRQAQPGQLIAFPSWRSDTAARLALAQAGLSLHELTRAYTPAGYPSIILYEIKSNEAQKTSSK